MNRNENSENENLLQSDEDESIDDYQLLPAKNTKKSTIDYNNNRKNYLNIFTNSKPLIIFVILVIFVIYINFAVLPKLTNEHGHLKRPNDTMSIVRPPRYLVWSDKCKMPNIDTNDPDTMKHFKRQKYTECSVKKPITNILFNNTLHKYIINVNEELTNIYKNTSMQCCYESIGRPSKGKNADKKIQLSKCLNFNNSVQIPNTIDNILVKCNSKKKQIYIDGFPMIQERTEIRDRLKAWKMNDTAKPLSILMIGIDSISRVNLMRAMPKTAQLLYQTEWFEMAGYNKMDDNTFPNLMAILTGFNNSNAFKICKPKMVGGLDKCPILWRSFRDNGYVTAYAEDEAMLSTFNYLKVGFEKPPVDYYFRPFLMAAEKNLPIKKKNLLNFCLGYKHSAEYIYDYVFELAERYKNESYFGLFWTNTFSHNALSDCSSMDVKMAEYIQKLSTSGILNDSVVVFFSDHGIRFGPTRKYFAGHIEERLPFMFIWLPPWLKEKHPEFVAGLKANKNRLTNPYDIHMTLKHLLELSGRVKNLPKALDCPNCQSLLKPVPENRGCDEIGITDHWCTCISFENVSTSSEPVRKIALYTINYLNEYVSNFKNGSFSHICGEVRLANIISAYKSNLVGHKYINNLEEYTIVLQTEPGDAIFEATITRKSDTGKLEVIGTISRLNLYATDSKCISEDALKKYCHCVKH